MTETTAIPSATAFFATRWGRRVPMRVLFWRDIMLFGTAINIVAALGALLALGFKASLASAMLILHAPFPYNLFLVAAVWRTADLVDPKSAGRARLGAALWLVVVTIL